MIVFPFSTICSVAVARLTGDEPERARDACQGNPIIVQRAFLLARAKYSIQRLAHCEAGITGSVFRELRMKRYIYAFDSSMSARAAVKQLAAHGIDEEKISLIARTDIQLDRIPDRFLDARTDFAPALARGAAVGGTTGLFAGIIAMAIPALGIAIGGPALIGFLAGGALLGAWSSALVGSSVPDVVRRKFEDEIASGRTLLVIETSGNDAATIAALMERISDHHLLWQSDSDQAAAA